MDRVALGLRRDDTVLAITSAGCNVLDYALTGPRRVWAVDANPRQTALLELKLAGIRGLDFDDFFAFFGAGHHPQARAVYADALRPALSPFARRFWDARIGWFDGRSGSFYFHGLSGLVARAFRAYLTARPRLAAGVSALFEADSLDEQRRLFDTRVQPELWGPAMNWTLSRPFTMSLLGVPHPQRREVRAQHERGIAGFIRESVEYVFRQLPARTNYFWAVYVHGRYTEDCCPEYLKRDNFEALKDGLVDRIEPHTGTVTGFLQDNEVYVSRFVLLDHMDWMASYRPDALAEEWRAILARATPDARIIFRSAHATPAYLAGLDIGGGHGRLRDALRFDGTLARHLQRLDRVHTYAGFHIAEPVRP